MADDAKSKTLEDDTKREHELERYRELTSDSKSYRNSEDGHKAYLRRYPSRHDFSKK